MLKMFSLLIVISALVGCEANTKETTSMWELPPELSHCKFYRMTSENGSTMRVVVCPNSTTTSITKNSSVTVIN